MRVMLAAPACAYGTGEREPGLAHREVLLWEGLLQDRLRQESLALEASTIGAISARVLLVWANTAAGAKVFVGTKRRPCLAVLQFLRLSLGLGLIGHGLTA